MASARCVTRTKNQEHFVTNWRDLEKDPTFGWSQNRGDVDFDVVSNVVFLKCLSSQRMLSLMLLKFDQHIALDSFQDPRCSQELEEKQTQHL